MNIVVSMYVVSTSAQHSICVNYVLPLCTHCPLLCKGIIVADASHC